MLNRCIATDSRTFADEYWDRKPLLSRSDELPRDFGDLLSADMVDELIAERGVRAPFLRMAKEGDVLARDCYLGPAGFGAEIADQVDSAKVLGEFAAGATIVLQGLHRLWPPVIDFVRHAVDDLGRPVQANAYITPPSNRGFAPHYDVHDVFVLQTAGQKRWIVHQPVHAHPLPAQPWTLHKAAIERRATEEPIIDAVLAPGDALYLPRGWVHSARAQQTTSIHLTIGVSAVTRLDVVRSVLEQLASRADFRESLPMGVAPTDHDETRPTVSKVLAELAATLRDDATELCGGAATLLNQRHAEQTRPVSVRPLASFEAAGAVERVRVHWRHGLTATLEESGERVVLRLPDRVMTFPSSCAAAVLALHRGLVTDADGLPGLDRPDASVLIRRLLREAVVVPAARG